MDQTTKRVTVQILNAFTHDNQGGNPAGVVLEADDLSHDDKLQIARKVGLSETAFVSQSETADFKLDFFTPNKQIAHCGHATIATFSFLRQIGTVRNAKSSKETIDGNREILLIGDLAFMEQKAPAYQHVTELEERILASINLNREQLTPGLPIQLVNTGNSFLIIPVTHSKDLAVLRPDFDQIEAISEELDLIGYYVYTSDTATSGLDATSRMFAPRFGIAEEAATGMAAGPLACYLHDFAKQEKANFRIQQGKLMPKPSLSLLLVKLQIANGTINNLMVGGKGVRQEQIVLDLVLKNETE